MAGTDKADKYYADSTARIADEDNIPAGWIAEDNDTGDRYARTTSGWAQVRGSGAALVTLSDAPVESLYDNDTIAIATGTVTAQIVPSMELWQEMEFEVDLTATDTITVKQSIDGVTYFATDPIDMSDGALLGAAGVVSADGLFRMPLIGTHASFTKGGAGAGAATIKWRARVVGR